MLTRLRFLVLALLALACGPASPPTPEEAATVVIVESALVLGEGGVELVTSPVCGGVAVGPRSFVTVDHCVGVAGSAASYVDSERWRSTTDFFEDGVVVSVEAGVALVRTARAVPGYVPRAAAADGPALLVRLDGSDLRAYPTTLSGFDFDAPVFHGSSGFGIFQGGPLVGLVDTCFAPLPDNGTECLETGGSFYPVAL